MHTALTAYGTITASEYEKLTEAQREERTGGVLKCPGCERQAFFVRRSRNGRAAKFASRRHPEDCPDRFARASAEPAGVARVVEDEPITNDGTTLVITLGNPTGDGGGRRTVVDGEAEPQTYGRRHTAGGAPQRRDRRTTGLIQLLRHLQATDNVRESECPLILSDKTETTVGEACIPADEFDDIPEGRVIVWGRIFSVNSEMWVNSGSKGSGRPAVRIPSELLEGVLERFGTPQLANLEDGMFIVEAEFTHSEGAGPYTTLEEVKYLAAIPYR